jgi:hypothetical protein
MGFSVITFSFIYISDCTVTNHSAFISFNPSMTFLLPETNTPLMEYCPHSGFSGKHETVLQWFYQVSFGEQSPRFLLFIMAGFMLMMSLLSPQMPPWPTC